MESCCGHAAQKLWEMSSYTLGVNYTSLCSWGHIIICAGTMHARLMVVIAVEALNSKWC